MARQGHKINIAGLDPQPGRLDRMHDGLKVTALSAQRESRANLNVFPHRLGELHPRIVARKAAHERRPYVQVGSAATIVSEDRQRTGTHFLTSMLIGFAVFATLLAILGIYGVTTYAVQQREREIAVRVALGGSHGAIIRIFLKQGAHVLAIGLGLGWFGAIGVAKILESRVYGVQPFDVATLHAS